MQVCDTNHIGHRCITKRRGSVDKRYTVAQTVQITGLKPYVLRYWEEELDLRIGRNELGHRYYTGYDIQLFMNIQELKKRGLQLKAIKELVPQIARNAPGMSQSKVRLLEDTLFRCILIRKKIRIQIRRKDRDVKNCRQPARIQGRSWSSNKSWKD